MTPELKQRARQLRAVGITIAALATATGTAAAYIGNIPLLVINVAVVAVSGTLAFINHGMATR